MSSALPLIQSGKLQALAVSTATQAPTLPQVATTVEAAVPGSEYTFWVGMIVASQTPPALIRRLHEEALTALASPEVKARLTQLGAEPLPMSPEACNACIKSEMQVAARIAKAAKLQTQ